MSKTAVVAPAPMEPNPKIATRYDYPSIARPSVDFPKDDPNSRSITNQSDKDASDINLIMARYEKTGLITVNGVTRPPMYGDFSGIGDFHKMQDTIAKVNQAFDAYPASIRTKFGNDAANMIDFLADSKNDPEAVALGLKDKSVLPPKAENPPAAPVVPPAQPAGPAA